MIEITNKTKFTLPRKIIISTLDHAAHLLKIKQVDISVVFLTPSAIRKLNLLYRAKDMPTDVLSFSYEHSSTQLSGEIILCPSIAKAQAKQFRHSFKKELQKLLVHSLLHLTGYDHQTNKEAQTMERHEERIIKLLQQ